MVNPYATAAKSPANFFIRLPAALWQLDLHFYKYAQQQTQKRYYLSKDKNLTNMKQKKKRKKDAAHSYKNVAKIWL